MHPTQMGRDKAFLGGGFRGGGSLGFPFGYSTEALV